jgi:Spy/CpxP family protein refolding chaperone
MRRNQVFVLVMTLAAATAAQDVAAQQARGHEQHAGEARRQPGGGRHQRLFEGVQLTDAQQQQVRAIFQEDRPARAAGPDGQRAERREGTEGRKRGERRRMSAEQRAQFEQRREQQIARIRAVLTAEQRAQFDRNVAQQEARRGEHAGRRGGRRGGGRES